MTKTLTLDTIKRGMIVRLAISASRPILTLDGTLHQAEQDYKVLGTHGTLVRLSRVSDFAKLMICAEDLYEQAIHIPPASPRTVSKLEGASVGDAVVIVIAGGTHQSAILTHFSPDRAHFAWRTGPGRYDGAACSIHSSKWNRNIIAVFPKGAKFLAV